MTHGTPTDHGIPDTTAVIMVGVTHTTWTHSHGVHGITTALSTVHSVSIAHGHSMVLGHTYTQDTMTLGS